MIARKTTPGERTLAVLRRTADFMDRFVNTVIPQRTEVQAGIETAEPIRLAEIDANRFRPNFDLHKGDRIGVQLDDGTIRVGAFTGVWAPHDPAKMVDFTNPGRAEAPQPIGTVKTGLIRTDPKSSAVLAPADGPDPATPRCAGSGHPQASAGAEKTHTGCGAGRPQAEDLMVAADCLRAIASGVPFEPPHSQSYLQNVANRLDASRHQLQK